MESKIFTMVYDDQPELLEEVTAFLNTKYENKAVIVPGVLKRTK
ncbi:hypothetical protein [Flavobacterium sp. NRK1]|nr:hypothetical protein [Flavobacterium sp. NRK1]